MESTITFKTIETRYKKYLEKYNNLGSNKNNPRALEQISLELFGLASNYDENTLKKTYYQYLKLIRSDLQLNNQYIQSMIATINGAHANLSKKFKGALPYFDLDDTPVSQREVVSFNIEQYRKEKIETLQKITKRPIKGENIFLDKITKIEEIIARTNINFN